MAEKISADVFNTLFPGGAQQSVKETTDTQKPIKISKEAFEILQKDSMHNGADLLLNQVKSHVGTASVDPLEMEIDATSGLNNDEKATLKNNYKAGYWTPEETQQAIKTVSTSEDGSGQYFFDHENKGLPKRLKLGERVPKTGQVESLWGNQISAEDDSWYTNIGKGIFNAGVDLGGIIPALINLGYQGITGKEMKFNNAVGSTLDHLKFATKQGKGLIDPKAFESASEFFNSENWHPSADNMSLLTGQVIGSVMQFLVAAKVARVGGSAAQILKGGGTAAQKTSAIAKVLGVSSAINMAQAEDSADIAGITGREKAAMVAMTSIALGMLEIGIGKQDLRWIADPVSAANMEMKKTLTTAAAQAFKDSGGRISKEALQSIYEATLDASKTAIPKFYKTLLKDSGGEALQEASQGVAQIAIENMHDYYSSRTGPQYGSKLFSKETAAEVFNGAIGGIIGGGFGATMTKVRGGMPDESGRDKTIYDYVKAGKEADLKNQLTGLWKEGKLSQDEYDNTLFKIDNYGQWNKDLEKLGVQVSHKERQKYFNLSWENKNLINQIEVLKEKATTPGLSTDAIENINNTIEILEKEIKGNKDGLSKIFRGEQKNSTENPEIIAEPMDEGDYTIQDKDRIISHPDENIPAPEYMTQQDYENEYWSGLIDPETGEQKTFTNAANKNNEIIAEKPKEERPARKKQEKRIKEVEERSESVKKKLEEAKQKFSEEPAPEIEYPDLSDESEFVKTNRKEDQQFEGFIKVHESIMEATDKWGDKPATEGQEIAIEHLLAGKVISEEESEVTSKANASEAITTAVRRIQYRKRLLQESTDPTKKEKIAKLNAQLKSLNEVLSLSAQNQHLQTRKSILGTTKKEILEEWLENAKKEKDVAEKRNYSATKKNRIAEKIADIENSLAALEEADTEEKIKAEKEKAEKEAEKAWKEESDAAYKEALKEKEGKEKKQNIGKGDIVNVNGKKHEVTRIDGDMVYGVPIDAPKSPEAPLGSVNKVELTRKAAKKTETPATTIAKVHHAKKTAQLNDLDAAGPLAERLEEEREAERTAQRVEDRLGKNAQQYTPEDQAPLPENKKSDYDSIPEEERGIELRVTSKVRAVFNRKEKAFYFYNSAGKQMNGKKQRMKYAKKITPKTVRTWWNELADDKQKSKVKEILYNYIDLLRTSIDETITLKALLMQEIQGVKFTPITAKDLTDIDEKVWISKTGYSIDTFVTDHLAVEGGVLEEHGFSGYDEFEIIEAIKEVIGENPSGITNKSISKELQKNSNFGEIKSLEEDYFYLSGLDLSESVLPIQQIIENEKSNIEELSEDISDAEISEDFELPGEEEVEPESTIEEQIKADVKQEEQTWEAEGLPEEEKKKNLDPTLAKLDKWRKELKAEKKAKRTGKDKDGNDYTIHTSGLDQYDLAIAAIDIIEAGYKAGKMFLEVISDLGKFFLNNKDYKKLSRKTQSELWLKAKQQAKEADPRRLSGEGTAELDPTENIITEDDLQWFIEDIKNRDGIDLTREDAIEAIAKSFDTSARDVDKKNINKLINNITGVTTKQASDAILRYVKTSTNPIDPDNLKDFYGKIPDFEGKIAAHLTYQVTKEDLVSLHNFFQSSRKQRIVAWISQKDGSYAPILSNAITQDPALIRTLREAALAHQEKFDTSTLQKIYEEAIARSKKITSELSDIIHNENNGALRNILKGMERAKSILSIPDGNKEQQEKATEEYNKLLVKRNELLNKQYGRFTVRKLINGLVRNDAQLAEAVTGIEAKYWEAFIRENKQYGKQGFKKTADSFEDALLQGISDYGGKFVNNLVTFQLEGRKLAEGFPEDHKAFYDSVMKGILEESTKAKSQIKTAVSAYLKQFGDVYLDKYTGVDSKKKTAIQYHNTLELDAEALPTRSKESRLDNNEWAKEYRSLSKGVEIHYIDGIKNTKTDEANDVSDISGKDMFIGMILNFINPPSTVQKGKYLNFFEVFSDKKALGWVPAKKYSTEEAKKLYIEKVAGMTGVMTVAEVEAEAEELLIQIKVLIQNGIIDISKPVWNESLNRNEILNPGKLAYNFAWNNALNKAWINDYFMGKAENYNKKGVYQYFNEVKRQGLSNGVALLSGIKGGLGVSHRHASLVDPRINVELSKLVKFDQTEATDGVSWITEEFAEKVRISSGGVFNFDNVLKPFYREVHEDGSVTLLKTAVMVLPKAFAKNHPNLNKLLEWMNANKIDHVTFTSGAKVLPEKFKITPTYENNSVLFKNLPTGKKLEGKIQDLKTSNWLFQQDLRQATTLKPGDLTRQAIRYAMSFGNVGTVVQELFNKVASKEKAKLTKTLKALNEKQQKTMFLSMISDTEDNTRIRELLSDPKVSINHPVVSTFIKKLFPGIIEKKLLGVKGNKGIAIETADLTGSLKEIHVKDGKIIPPEAMLPENYRKSETNPSGLNEGDVVFITRVPSTGPHSTSLVTVKGFLDPRMGSAIITSVGVQKIAGADNDGDGRHIWAQYKNKKGEVITGDSSEGLINQAFQALVDEYENPENFEKLISPINLEQGRIAAKPYKEELKMKRNSALDALKMRNVNNDGKSVISIAAMVERARAHIKAHGVFPSRNTKNGKVRKNIKFFFLDDNGNPFSIDLNSFVSRQLDGRETAGQQLINELAANDANQATDNANEQNLVALGLTNALASTRQTLLAMMSNTPWAEKNAPASINKFLTRFMHHSVVEDYVKEYNESQSPTYTGDQNKLYETIAERYAPGSTKQREDSDNPAMFSNSYLKNRPLTEAEYKLASEPTVTPANREAKVKTLKYLQQLNFIARDVEAISRIVKLTESAPDSYADLLLAKQALNKIRSNKFINLDTSGFLGSPFIEAAENSIEVSELFYDRLIIGSPAIQQVFERIGEAVSTKETSPLNQKIELTREQLDLVEKEVGKYVSVKALEIDRSRTAIEKEAKAWFEALPENNYLKSIFFIDEKGVLGLKTEQRQYTMDLDDAAKAQKAFAALPKQDKQLLIDNQAVHFGITISTKGGGYEAIFDAATSADISKRMDSYNKKLQNPQMAIEITRAIQSQNASLVGEPKIKINGGTVSYDEQGQNPKYSPGAYFTVESGARPPFIKRTEYSKGKAPETRIYALTEVKKKDGTTDYGYPANDFIVKKKWDRSDYTQKEQSDTTLTLTDDDKIIFGHPAIGKTFAKKSNDFIDVDEDYKEEHGMQKILRAHAKNTGKKEDLKKWEDYIDKWWSKIKSDANKSGKKIFVSNLPILRMFSKDFDKVITISKEEFIKRAKQRNDYKENETEEWKELLDKEISKIDKSRLVFTDKYLSNLLPERLTISQEKKPTTFKEKYDKFLSQLRVKDDNYYIHTVEGWKKLDKEAGNIDNKPSVIQAYGMNWLVYKQNKFWKIDEAISGLNSGIAGAKTKKQAIEALNQIGQEKVERGLSEKFNQIHSDTTKLSPRFEYVKGENVNPELKYQKQSVQEKATDDYVDLVREHLNHLYPAVAVFDDPVLFQKYLDKHFPGKKLDVSALGAAIANTLYINPNTERQDTRIHEYAHLYWDMLPANDPTKLALMKQFSEFINPEERAVYEIGVQGIDQARSTLEGGKLNRFKELLRIFWSKVKALFHVANKEDYARILADRIWNNSDNLNLADAASNQLKYSLEGQDKIQERWEKFKREIKNQKNLIFDDANGKHDYSASVNGELVPLISATQLRDRSSLYKFTGGPSKTGDIASERGTAVHKYLELIFGGLTHEQAIEESGIEAFMTKHAQEKMKDIGEELHSELKKEGEILSESRIASVTDGVATTIDIIIGKDNGNVNIYDIKTSLKSTEGPGYQAKTFGDARQRSKADTHSVQLNIIEQVLKWDDEVTDRSGMHVDKKAIIPIKITVKDDTITDVELEPVIDMSHDRQASVDAKMMIQQEVDRKTNEDEDEFARAKPKDKYEYADAIDFDLREISDEVADLNEKIEGLTKTAPTKGEKELFKQYRTRRKILNDKLAAFSAKYEKYKVDLKACQKLLATDINSLSEKELKENVRLLYSYDNIANNKALRKLQEAYVTKLEAGAQRGGDISWIEKMFSSPGNTSSRLPAMQRANNLWLDAHEKMIRRKNPFLRGAEEKLEALLKSQGYHASIKEKLKAYYDPESNVKDEVFKNMIGKKGQLKTSADPSLTKEEADFLQYMEENMAKYTTVKPGYTPKVMMSFHEMAKSMGRFRAVAHGKNYNVAMKSVIMKFVNPNTGKEESRKYGDIIDILDDYQKDKGKGTKIRMEAKMRRLAMKAEDLATKKVNEDGSPLKGIPEEKEHYVLRDGVLQLNYGPAKYKMNASGELTINADTALPNPELYTKDLFRAFTTEIEDRIYVHEMNQIMPELLAVNAVFQTIAHEKKDYVQASDMFSKHMEKDIMHQNIDVIPEKWQRRAAFWQAWTYFKVMTFNIPLAAMNVVQGTLSNFVNLHVGDQSKAFKRYFGDWKKAQAILEYYHVNTGGSSKELNSENKVLGMFEYLSGILVRGGENYIQGIHFLSGLTENEWNAFELQGDKLVVVDKAHLLTTQKTASLRKKKDDAQGYYDVTSKPVYAGYAGWRALMQFKTWMPAYFRWHWSEYNKDVFGNETKGTLNSLFDGLSMLKDKYILQTTPGYEVKEVDKENWRKLAKEFAGIGLMMAVYAMAHGDDEDKKKADDYMVALGQLGAFYSLKTYGNLTDKIFPAAGTMTDFIKASHSLITAETFKRNGFYYDEGDLKAPGQFMNVMPYKNVFRKVGLQKILDEE